MQRGDNRTSTDRRRILQALGTIGTVGLAGCGGQPSDGDDGGDGSDGGDGGGQQGERVPTLVLTYWTNHSSTPFYEATAEAIQQSVQQLGIEAEINAVDFGTGAANLVNDAREEHIVLGTLNSIPTRLDPGQLTRWPCIDWASTGSPNVFQYASCEYSVPALQSERATSPEERQQLVDEAQSVFSHDCVNVPLVPSAEFGAYRTDMTEPGRIGNGGINQMNPLGYIYSTPTDQDALVASVLPTTVQTRQHMNLNDVQVAPLWSRLIYSPLVGYNEEFELENELASDYELSGDGTTLTVEIKDATFHNGDPVTAEDVAFTFEYVADNAGLFPLAEQPPYASIEAIDETTTEFNLESPYPSLVPKIFPKWGIVPRAVWEDQGAVDNPDGFEPDPVIGSGPYELDTFEQGSSMYLVPTDQDHPMHNPDHDIEFRAFTDISAARRALTSGEIHMASILSVGAVENLEENYADTVEVRVRRSFVNFPLYLQYPQSPTKFLAFRQAVAKVLNRQLIAQLGFRGFEDPVYDTSIFNSRHPWRTPDDMLYFPTEEPQGDVEDARATLEDAGWSWDSNDRLRFPADADLSPRWPQGERPDPADHPCLTADYEVVDADGTVLN